MKEIARYSGCFVCGDNNDYGLKAKFYFKNDAAVTECTAQKRFEGYYNVYHGGITATLLDEVMIKGLLARDIFAMTVEINIKYHKLVSIGQKLFFEGKLDQKKGRLYLTTGQVKTENGDVVASATGKYLEVKSRLKEELLKSLEF